MLGRVSLGALRALAARSSDTKTLRVSSKAQTACRDAYPMILRNICLLDLFRLHENVRLQRRLLRSDLQSSSCFCGLDFPR